MGSLAIRRSVATAMGWSLLALSLAAVGCDRGDGDSAKESEPRERKVELHIPRATAFIGAEFFVGDELAGYVQENWGYRSSRANIEEAVKVDFYGTEETIAALSERDDLVIRAATPCGELDFPLEFAEETYSKRLFRVETPMDEWPASADLWIDAEYLEQQGRSLILGEREYTHADFDEGRAKISGFDCAESYDVQLGDEVIATIEQEAIADEWVGTYDPNKVAVFVSPDEDACYRKQSRSYSKDGELAGGGGMPSYLETGHVHYFRKTDIESFLSEAPASVSDPGGGFEHIVELVEVSCDEI